MKRSSLCQPPLAHGGDINAVLVARITVHGVRPVPFDGGSPEHWEAKRKGHWWPNSASSQVIGPGPGDQYMANSGLVTGWRCPAEPSPDLSLVWNQTPPGLHVPSQVMLSFHLPTFISWAAEPTGASPDLPPPIMARRFQPPAVGRHKQWEADS